jgi:HK97 family phage major capsid protein
MENLTPEQVVEKINEKFNKALENMPTKGDLDSLKSDVETLKTLEAKSQEIEKAIARFEGKMEAMAEKGFKSEKAPRSMGEAISKAYVDNIEKIKETAEKGGVMSLETKALYDTTIDGDYTGNVALSTLEAGVSKIARPIIKIRDIVNMGITNSKFVTYISQKVQTASAWVDEAGEKVSGQPSYEEISEQLDLPLGTVKAQLFRAKDMLYKLIGDNIKHI